MIVIDASALIAFLLRETGHDTVARRLGEACMSTVNFSEVLARMSREKIVPGALASKLIGIGLSVLDFDQPQAIIASEIRDTARGHGIGMADCCCIALAMHRVLPVLTADRAWLDMRLAVDIQLIR